MTSEETLQFTRTPPAQLAPLQESKHAQMVQRVTEHYGGNVPKGHLLLMNNADFWAAWLRMGSLILLEGSLTAAHRELLILRTAANLKCDVERITHHDAALAAGLDESKIAAILDVSADLSDPIEHLLLQTADTLWRDGGLDAELWEALKTHWSEAQIMEILCVVGHYTTTAYLMRSMGLVAA